MSYYNPITTIASVGTQSTPIPVTIASATEPTTRENGGTLRQGDNWYNTTTTVDNIWITNSTGGSWKIVGTAAHTPATSSRLGSVMVGSGINVTPFGSISVANAPILNPGVTLWGHYFNGSSNIIGNISSVGVITGSGDLVLKSGPSSAVFFRCFSTTNQYMFNNSTGSAAGNLKFENLTASRTYSFPDAGGTLALTSDITISLLSLKSIAADSSDFSDFQTRIAAL
jgi:hypothetical protein